MAELLALVPHLGTRTLGISTRIFMRFEQEKRTVKQSPLKGRIVGEPLSSVAASSNSTTARALSSDSEKSESIRESIKLSTRPDIICVIPVYEQVLRAIVRSRLRELKS